MAVLSSYYVPGMHVQDCSIDVPLDWSNNTPGKAIEGKTIKLFYRVLCAPEHVNDKLPLLVFLQGGPGGMGPRPMSAGASAWINFALKHFRVILPDQRGTGRSNHLDGKKLSEIEGASRQASYLKKFLADSIVRDFEHLRLSAFSGEKWVSLGQSYGGFLTLTYLSLFPEGLIASFTTGGIPHIPADAGEVYRHTFPRMKKKSLQYYERYPEDMKRVRAIATYIAEHDVLLPNGDKFTPELLQTIGQPFGIKTGFERAHWLFDTAFYEGDGSVNDNVSLTESFLFNVMDAVASSPLYWPLQEFIYANGELEKPINWAANQLYQSMPEFSCDQDPFLFTGEGIFPWMFENQATLKSFAPAMKLLMQDTHFGKIYDECQLKNNEVPLQSAVYFDDMYVDSGLQLDTLSRIGNSHYWTTNEYEHDGIHGGNVFEYLFNEMKNRGDLKELY